MAAMAGEEKTTHPTLRDARERHGNDTAFVFRTKAPCRGLIVPDNRSTTTPNKLNATLVLDRSGSMGSQVYPVLQGVCEALKKVCVTVNVIAFDHEVEIYPNTSLDLLSCLSVEARGLTHMAPTVSEVAKFLKPNSLLIIVSDGAIDDPKRLEDALSGFKRVDHVTVVGLRVGNCPNADTEAISGWVSATGEQGTLRTVEDVTTTSISSALCDCFEEMLLYSRVNSCIYTLHCDSGVGQTPFHYDKTCTATSGQILFLPCVEDPTISLDDRPLPVVEISVPIDMLVQYIRGAFRKIKFSMVSGDKSVNYHHQLETLIRMIPEPVHTRWAFMRASEIARIAQQQQQSANDIDSLRHEMLEVKNRVGVLCLRNQQQKAEFIRGRHATKFMKRTVEAGVSAITRAVLEAARHIKENDLTSDVTGFLSLNDTYTSILEGAEVLENCSFSSVRDVLNAVGIVGLAVDLRPRPVIPDAWTLWGVIRTVFVGPFSAARLRSRRLFSAGIV